MLTADLKILSIEPPVMKDCPRKANGRMCPGSVSYTYIKKDMRRSTLPERFDKSIHILINVIVNQKCLEYNKAYTIEPGWRR